MLDKYNPMSVDFDPGDEFWKKVEANHDLKKQYCLGYDDGQQDFIDRSDSPSFPGHTPKDIRDVSLADASYWSGYADGMTVNSHRMNGDRWSVDLDGLGDDD